MSIWEQTLLWFNIQKKEGDTIPSKKNRDNSQEGSL